MDSVKSISIVGTGNVAFHLGKALINSGFSIVDLYGRNDVKARELASLFNCLLAEDPSSLKGEIVLLCIGDQAIQELAEQIPAEKIVIHTSGGISMESLKSHQKCGVLYPLQTLSKARDVSFSSIPLLIEASEEDVLEQLDQIAKSMSQSVVHVTSAERKRIHLAAVFVNNFVNHLVFKSKNIMDNNDLDWNLLLPLLDETINKLKEIGPFEAQTGPARRDDVKTIHAHLSLLSGNDRQLYQLLTDSIKNTYNA